MNIFRWLFGVALAALLAGPAIAQLAMPDGTVVALEDLRTAGRACNSGSHQACLVAGLAARHAAGQPMDIDMAAAAFAKACKAGLGMGCLGEADIAATRRDRRRDLKLAADRWARANTLFSAACEKNLAIGCHNLADMLATNAAMIDRPRAVALFARACFELKHGASCVAGAALTEQSASQVHDQAMAIRFAAAIDPTLEAECKQERPAACAMLAQWLDRRLQPGDGVRITALADSACSAGAGAGCSLAASLVRREDASAEGWDRQVAYLDRACSTQFARCAELAETMRDHPPIRTIDTGLLFIADIKACLGDVQENCWRLYEPAARLNSTELAQLVETFDHACLKLLRASAELCAAAASNHLERSEALPASAASDRAEAQRLYRRALELPEDAEDNATAHSEARAYLDAGN